LTVRKAEFSKTHSPQPWKNVPVVARADGYGLSLRLMDSENTSVEATTLRLVKDDAPISGRILDLQGKPVVGAKVRVRNIRWPRQGNLTAFVQALKTRKEGGLLPQYNLLHSFAFHHRGWNLDGIFPLAVDEANQQVYDPDSIGRLLGGLFPPVFTDANVRFRIPGIGSERVADLLIEGPGIETNYVYAMTRPCDRIEL